MNEIEEREDEEVDVVPFTGAPDKDLPRHLEDGAQDDVPNKTSDTIEETL